MGQLTYGLSFTANRTQLSDDVVNAVNLYIARSVESGTCGTNKQPLPVICNPPRLRRPVAVASVSAALEQRLSFGLALVRLRIPRVLQAISRSMRKLCWATTGRSAHWRTFLSSQSRRLGGRQ